jgi:transcription elongation factor GreA
MNQHELDQVIREGNHGKIESAWMEALAADDLKPSQLAAFAPHVAELSRSGKGELAETLVWAAVEAAREQFEPADAVKAAGPLLQALGESESLRAQVSEMYRTAYREREGFEALLTEAGLPGGRPVRRALRTLEVALSINEGDYLLSRDDPSSARVEKIDRSDWRITIISDDGVEVLGAVHLADRYEPTSPNDLMVLKQFDREGLLKRLDRDPVSIISDLCKRKENQIDSDELRELFVPDLMNEAGFKKWWTKARGALKGVPFLQIEGRSPYVITFIDRPITFEDILRREFENEHDLLKKLGHVEQYLKDCAAANQEPSSEELKRCYGAFAERAERAIHAKRPEAGLYGSIACRVGQAASIEGAVDALLKVLKDAKNLRRVFDAIPDDGLMTLACEMLIEARPEDWRERFLELLPFLPQSVCDYVATRLVEGGSGSEAFAPIVQKMLGSAVECFEGLLWLWDGPSKPQIASDVVPVTVLTRILRALDESRRDDVASKEQAKRMAVRARSVLSARKYERFVKCLSGVEAGMANALKTQINQLDALGRAVKEDMLGLILDHFPSYEARPRTAVWAREDILFVTEEGLARKQSEIDHHVNVKMRENAKAIGAAAEKGDLSENSEYKFALEERDLLRARLMNMNNEMAIARVINPSDVPTDKIGIGTKAVFEQVDNGERYELAFLGPWDADPAKGWLNYKSPLAQGLMGKKIGETVEFDHGGVTGTYRIAELHNALQEVVSRSHGAS